MFGLVCVRAMEMMGSYQFDIEDDEPTICVKCGREGCECGPDCECGTPFDKTLPSQEELIRDFEE